MARTIRTPGGKKIHKPFSRCRKTEMVEEIEQSLNESGDDLENLRYVFGVPADEDVIDEHLSWKRMQ